MVTERTDARADEHQSRGGFGAGEEERGEGPAENVSAGEVDVKGGVEDLTP